MEIIYLGVGLLIGFTAVFFYFKIRNQKSQVDIEKEMLEKEKAFQEQKVEAEKNGLIWEERFQALKKESDDWRLEIENLRDDNKNLNVRLEMLRCSF